MNFEIAQIVLPLELAGYAEAYAGKQLLVWVNPPRDVKRERESILRDYSRTLKEILTPASDAPVPEAGRGFLARLFRKLRPKNGELEKVNARMFVWLATIWSQHEDVDCAWPVEDIRELYDAEPALYQWMARRSVQMIADFEEESKKK